MDPPLKFEHDEVGDILYIRTVPPYPEQVTDQIEYNIAARRIRAPRPSRAWKSSSSPAGS